MQLSNLSITSECLIIKITYVVILYTSPSSPHTSSNPLTIWSLQNHIKSFELSSISSCFSSNQCDHQVQQILKLLTFKIINGWVQQTFSILNMIMWCYPLINYAFLLTFLRVSPHHNLMLYMWQVLNIIMWCYPLIINACQLLLPDNS